MNPSQFREPQFGFANETAEAPPTTETVKVPETLSTLTEDEKTAATVFFSGALAVAAVSLYRRLFARSTPGSPKHSDAMGWSRPVRQVKRLRRLR